MEWSYSEDRKRIVLDKPPIQKLRITGHRLATVLGVDQWSTPFKAWCEITKLVKAPFEESKYTLFDHPLVAGDFIKKYKDELKLTRKI